MRVIFLVLIQALCSLPSLWAQESYPQSRVEKKNHPFSANVSLVYTSLDNSTGTSLSGQGLDFAIHYALKEKMAVGFGVSQLSLGSDGSASSLSFRYTYAIWGKLSVNEEKVFEDSKLIGTNQERESKALCLQLLGTQYYLNASRNTVPYSGYGASVFYKAPLSPLTSYVVGTKYESLKNDSSITVMNLFLGLEFRI